MSMKLLTFIFCIFLTTFLRAGDDYRCLLNIAPEDSSIKTQDLSKFLATMSFQSGENKGVKKTVQNVEAFLWFKNNELGLKLVDQKRAVEAKASYQAGSKKMNLELAPHFALNCYHLSHIKDFASDHAVKLLQASEVQKIHQTDTSLYFRKNITFPYDGSTGGRMVKLFLQKGSFSYDLESIDTNQDYCALQARVEIDEPYKVYRGSDYKIQSLMEIKGKKKVTLSYSFVDFSSGEDQESRSLLRPMLLECELKDRNELSKVLGRAFKIKSP